MRWERVRGGLLGPMFGVSVDYVILCGVLSMQLAYVQYSTALAGSLSETAIKRIGSHK